MHRIGTGLFVVTATLFLALEAPAVDHSAWDDLLREYVDEGGVRYRVWEESAEDREALSAYVGRMEAVDPSELARPEALAYWINVYNAVTVKLVLDHYPVNSIKEIGGRFESPWKMDLFAPGGNALSLNDIENDVIRPAFDEPRIHFALNCAAVSCPPLRPEAYVSDRLDEQLEEQTVAFLGDPSRNWIDEKGALHLSKIFDWYHGDFTREGSVVDWVRPYIRALPDRGERVRVRHVDYDWSLNEAKTN